MVNPAHLFPGVDSDTAVLYYVHDPMCSWCWGFHETRHALAEQLPDNIQMVSLLGGLAPDSDIPMAQDMREMLQATWQRIATVVPGTQFNFDFWRKNTPRRSTFPSCRAVIAAALQRPDGGALMTEAIQRAYYLNAQNPSDDDVLIQLATDMGLDSELFAKQLHSDDVKTRHQEQMQFATMLGVQGYPSLLLQTAAGDAVYRIAIDYVNSSAMLAQIEQALTSA